MARCPGQDQRFWKLDDIFEANCPACGNSVEFWKDEPQVKCPSCKEMITNPKLDLGCAKWCKRAKECLGQIAGQESNIMCNKLIEELREVAGDTHGVVTLSLDILSYATNIQAEEGGDPLIVKAAAILGEINKDKAGQEQNPLTRNILLKHSVSSEQIDHICRIINACLQNEKIDSVEFKVVSDAQRLSRLNLQVKTGPSIKEPWNTATAQRLAENMSQN